MVSPVTKTSGPSPLALLCEARAFTVCSQPGSQKSRGAAEADLILAGTWRCQLRPWASQHLGSCTVACGAPSFTALRLPLASVHTALPPPPRACTTLLLHWSSRPTLHPPSSTHHLPQGRALCPRQAGASWPPDSSHGWVIRSRPLCPPLPHLLGS